MTKNPFTFTIVAATTVCPALAQAQQARVVEDLFDVMNGVIPKLLTFPKLAKKSGRICGWIKDAKCRPLKNARVLIYSTAIDGAQTHVTARLDEKGLYEVLICGDVQVQGFTGGELV